MPTGKVRAHELDFALEKEIAMGASRPIARHAGTISCLLDVLQPWQRAEIRQTFALSNAIIAEITDDLGVDTDTVYRAIRWNPHDKSAETIDLALGHLQGIAVNAPALSTFGERLKAETPQGVP